MVVGVKGLASVEHEQNELGPPQRLASFFDALGFDFVAWSPPAGRVFNDEGDIAQQDRRFDHVSCRSGRGADDSLVLHCQRVQEAGFADVGPADNSSDQPLIEEAAALHPAYKTLDLLLCPGQT